MNNLSKALHVDLSGMMPSFDQFLKLIPIFADAGYDTLMIGWEDKFPWKEEGFRASNALSRDEILKIQQTAIDNGMAFIPMIQILGHLESFLSIDKYKSLREVDDRCDCLNPLAPGGLDFVFDLIDEVLMLSPHCDDNNMPPSKMKFIHLGGDEVWTMGTHPDTKAFIKKHSKAKLYIKHLRPIIDKLKERGIRPLLWHDMLVKWDDEELLLIKDDIDIVFWGYEGTMEETPYHYNKKYIKRFADLGFNLWGAGAFKGASGCASIMPNVKELVINASSWHDVASEFDFKGLMATGWGRYSQFHPPCDPIYSSFESLFIVSDVFSGQLDESIAIEKMNKFLKKYGLEEVCGKLKKASLDFSGSYSRAWACITNLHQQYVMEEKFVSDKSPHLAKVMFEDFEKEMVKLRDTSSILKEVLATLFDEQDILEFIDTKKVALESIFDDDKKKYRSNANVR